jgi:hypothetical protein
MECRNQEPEFPRPLASRDNSGNKNTQDFCFPLRAQALRPYRGYFLSQIFLLLTPDS